MPRVDLWSVTVAFPGHTHLLLKPFQVKNNLSNSPLYFINLMKQMKSK